jgi:hypothetical protein
VFLRSAPCLPTTQALRYPDHRRGGPIGRVPVTGAPRSVQPTLVVLRNLAAGLSVRPPSKAAQKPRTHERGPRYPCFSSRRIRPPSLPFSGNRGKKRRSTDRAPRSAVFSLHPSKAADQPNGVRATLSVTRHCSQKPSSIHTLQLVTQPVWPGSGRLVKPSPRSPTHSVLPFSATVPRRAPSGPRRE